MMDTGIFITSGINKESAEAASTGIVHILRAGFEAHVDSLTMQAALKAFTEAVGANSHNSVNNCSFNTKEIIN